MAFFSRKFSKSQMNYDMYHRELTAAYEAVEYFKDFLEGQVLKISTDHKALTYAFGQLSSAASPRWRRQLGFIYQFTTHIEHVLGSENVVADCLSRIDEVHLPVLIDMAELARHQTEDRELEDLLGRADHGLKLMWLQWGPSAHRVCCDHSGNVLRPYVPPPLRRRVFDMFHSLAHGSAKVTDQVIRQRYVWPGMHREIKLWCRTCLDCQASKVTKARQERPCSLRRPGRPF